jgi:hypothetical protein
MGNLFAATGACIFLLCHGRILLSFARGMRSEKSTPLQIRNDRFSAEGFLPSFAEALSRHQKKNPFAK